MSRKCVCIPLTEQVSVGSRHRLTAEQATVARPDLVLWSLSVTRMMTLGEIGHVNTDTWDSGACSFHLRTPSLPELTYLCFFPLLLAVCF